LWNKPKPKKRKNTLQMHKMQPDATFITKKKCSKSTGAMNIGYIEKITSVHLAGFGIKGPRQYEHDA